MLRENRSESRSDDRIAATSEVSGTLTTVPQCIVCELDVDDGDRLRWELEADGTLQVRVVQQRNGSFTDFEGYGGETETNVIADHDEWCRH